MSDGGVESDQRPVSLFKGGAWLVATAIFQRLATMATFLVVASLVSPEQVGLVAIVMAFVGAGTILSEFGISAALVQVRDLSQRYIDTSFTLSFVLTVLLTACLVAAAPLIAGFYQADQLTYLVWLAAVSLAARGFLAPLRGLMLRAQAYRLLSLMDLSGAAAGSLVTIVMVFFTQDVASLLYGQIAEAAVLLGAGIAFGRPLPRSVSFQEGRKSILLFGSTVSFSRVLDQISGTFDVLLIGKIFPPAALGYFYAGQRITTLVPQLVVSKLQQLMFPHFSRHQNDKQRLHHDYWTAVLVSGFVVGLICTLTLTCAEPAVLLFLGEEWAPAIPYVQVFSVAMMVQGLGGGVVGAFIYGTGQTDLTVWLSVFRIVAFPSCIAIGSQFGPMGVAWATVAYQLIGRLFSQLVVWGRCGLSMRPIGRITVQVLLPAGLGLLAATALDGLQMGGAVGKLAILVPTVALFFAIGCMASLSWFKDAHTASVRSVALAAIRRRAR